MLKTIKTKDEAMKLQIISEHVPVSVSIFSNVPDYGNKPIFYVIINLQTILNISLKAKSINRIKYNNIIVFLDAYVNNIQKDYERFL